MKFGEFVSTIVIEADCEDDAYEEAKTAAPESWSEWEHSSDEGYIEYDYIEEVKNDES
jgi:hypothetical protein